MEPRSDEEFAHPTPAIPHHHEAIEKRAGEYADRTLKWLLEQGEGHANDRSHPCAVLRWLAARLRPNVHRAFSALASWNEEDQGDYMLSGYNATANVVLLSCRRSIAAWVQLVNRELAPMKDVAPFIAELIRLSDEIEAIFPNARYFGGVTGLRFLP